MKEQLVLVLIAVLATSGCALKCSEGMKPVSEVIKVEIDGSVTVESNDNNEVTKKVAASTRKNSEFTCKSAN